MRRLRQLGRAVPVVLAIRPMRIARICLLGVVLSLALLKQAELRRLLLGNLDCLTVVRAALSTEPLPDTLRSPSSVWPFAHALYEIHNGGDEALARAYLRIAARSGDHTWAALYWQTRLAYRAGDRADARRALRELSQVLSPSHAAHAVEMACRSKDIEGCVSLYEELLERPDLETQERLLALRTLVRYVSYRDPVAVQCWAETGIGLAPSDAYLHRELARALLRQGRFDDAIEMAKIAASLGDQHASLYWAFGVANFRLGNLAEARSFLLRCVEKDPGLFDGWYYLGEVHWSLGDDTAAQEAWAHASEIKATDARLLKALERAKKGRR